MVFGKNEVSPLFLPGKKYQGCHWSNILLRRGGIWNLARKTWCLSQTPHFFKHQVFNFDKILKFWSINLGWDEISGSSWKWFSNQKNADFLIVAHSVHSTRLAAGRLNLKRGKRNQAQSKWHPINWYWRRCWWWWWYIYYDEVSVCLCVTKNHFFRAERRMFARPCRP